MNDGASKIDPKDAPVFLICCCRPSFFSVVRGVELTAAYRLMRHHMAVKKRVYCLRNLIPRCFAFASRGSQH